MIAIIDGDVLLYMSIWNMETKKEARERQSQLEKERDFEIENLAEQKKIAIEN